MGPWGSLVQSGGIREGSLEEVVSQVSRHEQGLWMLRKGSQAAWAAACAEELRKKEATGAFCLGVGGGERWLGRSRRKPGSHMDSSLAVVRKGCGSLLPHLSVAMSCDFSGLGKFKVTVWGSRGGGARGHPLTRAGKGQLGSWGPCLPHTAASMKVLLLRRPEWALFLYLWAA